MAKLRIHISESADPVSVDSLLKVLVVLLLEVNNNSTTQFKIDFSTWLTRAAPILTQLKLKREISKYANIYLLKGKFSHNDAIALGKLLKAAKLILEKDVSVSHEQLSLYKDIASSLHTDSPSAWKRIEKNVAVLRDPKLNLVLLPEESNEETGIDLSSITKKLREVVVKLTGNPGKLFLTPTELANLRVSHGDLLSEYAGYVRPLNKIVKEETLKFVRSAGKELVSIADLKDYLQKKKIPNNLPSGFLGGQVDETGKMYTKEGKQLDKTPFGAVTFNPKWDPVTDNTYVLQTVDTPRILYRTLDFLSGNKEVRHSKVKDFYKTESAYRKKWLADLLKVDTREQVAAAMVELLYKTACRIGGEGNATRGEPTYGLSTLQVRHLDILPTSLEFNYTGKKGAEQNHVFKANSVDGKRVYNIVKKLVAGKQPTDLVFTYRNKPVKDPAVRSYLKSIGVEISPHKFRHLAGTKIALGILNQSPFKASDNPKQSVVDKWVKTELEKVGEVLHHKNGVKVTSSTAIKSYIDPSIIQEFYDRLKLRIPKSLKTN